MRGRCAASRSWALRALQHGLASGRLRESAQGAADVVGHTVFGPLPFSTFAALARDELFTLEDPMAEAAGHALLAMAALATGDDPGFVQQEGQWRDVIDRNGLGWLGATPAIQLALIETSIGRAEAAERRLREAREVLVTLGDIWWIQSLDAELCTAVGAQGRTQDFLRLVDAFDASVPVSDRQVQVRRSLLRARAFMLRGSAADAEIAARRGLELVSTTDFALDHAEALMVLSDVLGARGQAEEAGAARAGAIERLRAKGNLAAVARLE
jgi:hypothetical protein